MLASIIVTLLNAIRVVLVASIEFLTAMILGVLFAILFALPWILRAASVLIWLGGDYLGISSIQAIYAPISPAMPVIALQFAVILMSVGWLLIVLSKNPHWFGEAWLRADWSLAAHPSDPSGCCHIGNMPTYSFEFCRLPCFPFF